MGKLVPTGRLISEAYSDVSEIHDNQTPKKRTMPPDERLGTTKLSDHISFDLVPKGLTRKAALLFGEGYPLKKGWRKRIYDCPISEEKLNKYRASRGRKGKKEKKKTNVEAREKWVEKKQQTKSFYISSKWRKLRYKALVLFGRKCLCCGAIPGEGVILHVDHIKPRSLYPELELDLNNLQILCEDCNLGKGNIDETDFR